MIYFRVSKYNPIYRNEKGYYLKEEWTDFSDIGKEFLGKKLTFEEYVEQEKAYIVTVLEIANLLEIEHFYLSGVEIYYSDDDKESGELFDFFRKYQNFQIETGKIIEMSLLEEIVSLILRNNFWARIVSERMEVHFGYDYYMYIGVSEKLDDAKSIPEKHGLFIENRTSPYIESEDDDEYDSDD